MAPSRYTSSPERDITAIPTLKTLTNDEANDTVNFDLTKSTTVPASNTSLTASGDLAASAAPTQRTSPASSTHGGGVFSSYPTSDFSNDTESDPSSSAADPAKNSTRSYWNTRMQRASRCYFPCITPNNEDNGADPHQHDAPPGAQLTQTEVPASCLAGLADKPSVVAAVQAAWGVVLQGYTLMDDVSFGFAPAVTAGSAMHERDLVLPFRIDCTRVVTFRDLTHMLTEEEALAQRYVLESECLDITMHNSYNTAVDFTYSEAGTSNTQIARLLGEQNGIVVCVNLSRNTPHLSIQHSASILSKSASQSLARSLAKTLEAVLRTPYVPIATFQIVHDDDIDLTTFHNVPETVPSCTHWLIADQIAKAPNKEAIVSGNTSLTYRELGQLSWQLANKLRNAGVTSRSYVGVCFHKSILPALSIVAIQMLGAAFVPLDPTAPPARWQSIMESVDANLVLCSVEMNEQLRSSNVGEIIVLSDDDLRDDSTGATTSDTSEWRSASVSPTDPSFVIFTSGSTGKPKGIIMQHDATCSTAAGYAQQLGIGPQSRVYQFSAYTFDMGVLDVLVTLMRGGCICMPTEHERWNELAASMTRLGANTVFLTPTVANLLSPQDVPHLTDLILAGEPVSQTLATRWQNRVRFHGAYGPTETSVSALSPEPVSDKRYKVGMPTNCAFWVIDPTQPTRLVPDGCVGELLAQGPILARGYISASEQAMSNWVTEAERLPPGIPLAKAYRTGDLVRKCTDGTYDYVGRKDSQVKIRGQRIELGEIEVQLSLALPPDMSGFVEVLREEERSQDSIACFLWYVDGPHSKAPAIALVTELSQQQRSLIGDIEGSLKNALSSYMIPSSYFFFEGCPEKTHSGKVDRKQLIIHGQAVTPAQRQAFSSSHTVQQQEMPTTDMELKLAELWALVLKVPVENIDKNDNFFRLGGDSVSAIRLVSDAGHSRIGLTVAAVFSSPRLRDMALVATADHLSPPTADIAPFSLLPHIHLDQRSVLEQVRQQCKLPTVDAVQDAYPCSAFQEGLMAVSTRTPGAYVEKLVYSLERGTDVAHFKAAWNQTVRLCDILRTRIALIDGHVPVQAVVQASSGWLEGPTLDSTLAVLDEMDFSYGTQLGHWAVVEEADGSWLFVLALHHALHDAWTLRNMFKLLEKLYWGEQSPAQQEYTMFVKYLTTIDSDEAQTFWRKRLAGAQSSAFPALTYDARPSETRRHFKATIATPVSHTGDASITKASVLRAAWALVLARYCETDDVCFGLTVSGRQAPLPQADQVVGSMIATVPARTRIDRSSSVEQYLRSVQDDMVEMMPFEQYGLQNIAKLGARVGEACRFSNLLVVQPANILNIGDENGDVSLLRAKGGRENLAMDNLEYPLVLQALTSAESVELVFTYDPSYLVDSQCLAVAKQLEHVVGELLRRPTDTLDSLTVSGPWDLQKVIEWNGAETLSTDQCLHDLVTRKCEERGEQEALYSSGQSSISYHQMDDMASLLANHLLSLGLCKRSIIPICFKSSIWAPIAMLGILKAGCAFVPLDPAHPEDRRRGLVEQVAASVVVTSDDFAPLCANLGVKHTVILSEDFFEEERDTVLTKQNSSLMPLPTTSSADTAYILFTSGSTGKPKGVVVQHQAVCTSIQSYRSKYVVDDSIRALQFSSYAFDASIYEIFMTLISGGCVCIPVASDRLQNVSKFIGEAKVNFAMLTPSFVRTLQPGHVPTLRTLMLIGEAPTLDIISQWRDSVSLMNGYGPTECCVLSDTHVYHPGENVYKASTVIGSNLHGCSWIVEPENVDVATPVGCVGELIIQSPALAQGYYSDADKTSAVFIDGIKWAPGQRAYKTGDLVRYRHDGKIEYIGRKDTQVKLRGQRLELGEIEHAIQASRDQVRQATVHLTRRSTGDLLLSFVELKDVITQHTGPIPTSGDNTLHQLDETLFATMSELNSRLKRTLPPYMVPSFVLPIKEMPLGSTTKADRQYLQRLADSLSLEDLGKYSLSTEGSGEKLEPITEKEFLLRDLWAQILHLKPQDIGREDSFLHIGGDSINAIHLSVLARKHGLEIPVPVIFEDSRLSYMAQAAIESIDSHESLDDTATEPFSLLRSDDIKDTLAQIRASCSLNGAEEVEDAYPCTPLQEGLLALGVKHPGSYIAKHVYRLAASTDLERFKSAWEHIYSICDNQRLRIVKPNQDSIQVLVGGDFAWEPTEGLKLSQFLQHASQDIRMSYGDKLTRSAIIQDPSSGERYFVWVNHHAIFDGWTISLLLTAFRRVYHGLDVAPFVPYSGFIKYASQLDMKMARDYWIDQLQGGRQSDFPPAKPMIDASPEGRKKVTRMVSREMPFIAPVKTSITKGTVLRAAWAVVLARYGNTDDVCFGATASGRNAPVSGVESMAGTVIGTVPVRIRIGADTSVRAFLRKVQSQALAMVPFEQTGFQNILRINEDTRQAADVSSLLIVQPEQQVDAMSNVASDIMTRPSEKEYSFVDTMEGYFTFPIVIQCHVYKETVTVEFTYDSSIVSGVQMDALCRHYVNVAQGLLAQDERPMSEVALTGDWDIQKAMQFNKHVKETVVDACIHDMISQRATETPDHEAIFTTDTSMTYARLDHLSSLLASHLVHQGVILETVVPICVDKSIWAPVAMLGIMKAGGVFLPMEPSHPYERRRALVEQVSARHLVTSTEYQSSCTDLTEKIIELSDEFFHQLNDAASYMKAPRPTPNNAAYVLFTSGSTGTPKGITVEHMAIASSITSHGAEFRLTPSSRVLQFASYVFDVSVSEVLTTLAFGATICVPSPTERLEDITGFINRSRTDVAMLTPSFVSTFSPQQTPGLKTLILGGEAPTKSTLDLWQPHLRLLNGYAPAECCIYALTHTYQSLDELPTILGKGMHSNCWVVEPQNPHKLAPIGCVGELVIQSNAIGRGYVGDETKTQQVFLQGLDWVPAEMQKPHYRFYLSGDLVRYDDHGDIEYLGRKDTQVKLRGQRIELGEIEYAIEHALQDVRYVAVEVIRKNSREALIVFVSFASPEEQKSVLSSGNQSNMMLDMTLALTSRFRQLVQDLRAKLPQYMVPGLFLPLRDMPFLSSMKIDRKSLRLLVDQLTAKEFSMLSLTAAEKQPPTTEMELRLRALWGQVLKIDCEDIGKNDSFFQLGGDSIAAVELLHLAQRHGVGLNIMQMFRNSVLSTMAASATVMDIAPMGGAEQSNVPLSLLRTDQVLTMRDNACRQCRLHDADQIDDIFPCTSMQEALLAISLKQPGAYMSTLVYRVSPKVHLDLFKVAWEKTVDACANLRTRFMVDSQPSSAKPYQVITKDILPWDQTDGETLKTYISRTGLREISYGSPLCRYALLQDEATGETLFALTLHHAIYDLWTLQLVVKVFGNMYQGTESFLHPYRDFVQYTADQNTASSRRWWKDQLQGARRAQYPRPPLPGAEPSQRVTHTMKAQVELPERVRSVITTATLVRAAWALLLSRYCDTADVCFGAAVSGRMAPLSGITDMPGPTIATVPVRLRLDATQSVADFLDTVQKHSTDMIPHEQFGVQNIANLSGDARDACELSNLLIIQPVQQVVSLMGEAEIMEEDEREETQRMLEAQLTDYFDDCALVMNCMLSDTSIDLLAYYEVGRVSEQELVAVQHHMAHVIRQLVTCSDDALGSIRLVDEWDARQAFTTQAIPELAAACTNELVSRQIEQHPEQVAVDAWDGTLTYAELGALAAALSQRLASLDIVSQGAVPLYMNRSKWEVVALLATQITGNGFMTIPCDSPEWQVRAQLRGSQAQVVLTTSENSSKLPDTRVPVIVVDQETIIEDGPLPLPRLGVQPQATSHVLYSSPQYAASKAVPIKHAAACSAAETCGRTLGIEQGTRVLHVTETHNFIGAIEVLTALTKGATLCIPSDDVLRNDFSQAISTSSAEVALLSPMAVDLASSAIQSSSLKVVAIGGDVAHSRHIQACVSAGVQVFTFYGTNESSICAWRSIDNTSDDYALSTKIGIPTRTRFVVLDPDVGALTPLGCVGELSIEGPMLADSNISGETLLSNYSSGSASYHFTYAGSAFRTGDLVRRNHDRSFDFVGRKTDRQGPTSAYLDCVDVECRLQETLPDHVSGIITRLAITPTDPASNFQTVAILWFKEVAGFKRAGFIPIEDRSNEIDDLILKANSSLELGLPNYMIPTSYLAFWGYPSGRLSGRSIRQAIIDTATNTPIEYRRLVHMVRRRKQPPSSPTEAAIRQLWASVLSVPAHEIGRHDSFIHHGGNSVSAIQVVSLAHRQGLPLTVASIFRNPRLCDLAASAAAISHEGDMSSTALIAPFSLLSGGRPSVADLEDIRAQCNLDQSQQIEDMYPCTALQEGLWALSLQNKGAYIAHYTFELGENIQVGKFKTAWERLVDMVAIMRTRLVLLHGTNVQVVTKGAVCWEQVEPGTTVSSYLRRASDFPTEYGALLSRFAIIGKRHFVWTVHHSMSDGWATALILDRLNKIYRGLQLPRTVSFASFIKYTQESDKSASQRYWDQQLQGAKRTVFPSGSYETHKPTSTYQQTIKFKPPPNLAFTKATVLQTAWVLLLAYYCETSDVCFGTTVTGRQAALPQIPEIVGPTIATVPFRMRLDYEESVDSVLRRLQDQNIDMVPHEQFGLQNIAKLSQRASEACDFTSLFTVQPSHFNPEKNSDDVLSEYYDAADYEAVMSTDSSYFTIPLVFLANITKAADVRVDVSYAPGLLTELRVKAMVSHFENITEQLMKMGDKPLKDISVAGAWDLERAISWNQEDISLPNVRLHDLFAKQIEDRPNHEAVYSTEKSLTYAELDLLTTQLAIYLRQHGVGPEVIVPYCFEKSVYAIISVWAIIKAGGAFMPMDPSHPTDYRQRLARQVDAQVMLVSPSTAPKCEGMAKHIISVSETSPCFQIDPSEMSVLKESPANPANSVYIIFSSGSTGVPKGIVIEHRSYAASLRGQQKHYGIGPDTRFIQFSNHVFDVACMEIVTTLCCGGTLCVPTDEERLQHTARFITESRTNFTLITPSFLRSLTPDQVPTLKTLLVGGEAMTDDLVQIWAPRTVLVNAYGPAEASVVSVTHYYSSPDDPGSNIGGPISNGNWVVDQHHPDRLAPIGCIGELVLQGPAIARGYINDPERTAKSFASHVDFLPRHIIDRYPRFYKTGDLVYYRTDGVLSYVGRSDTQVKIRGQRMELGDIETKILRVAPGIEHVVVGVLRQSGLEALVAFISFKDQPLLSDESRQPMIMPGTEAMSGFCSSVSADLAKLVPGHMLPTYYLPVAWMPNTSSGKMDRQALRAEASTLTPEQLVPYAASHRAPFRDCSTETETQVCSLWAKVLRLSEESISVDDNFYDLGGDSISIVTLMKRLQTDFGFYLSLSMINSRNTTISIMAKMINEQAVPETTLDLDAEVQTALDSMWIESIHDARFQPVTTMGEDTIVFLTGGTGFLGTQILRQLLDSPRVKRVVTLVRAASAELGLERLKRTATIAGWWHEDASERIETWVGDLGKKKLGLGGKQWAQLSGTHEGGSNIDCIIHNGAVVNWNADYQKLRGPNVHSVLELLKATVKSPREPKFVFISGGSSTDPRADRKVVAEEMAQDTGYSQTKFVSESVVYEIASRLPANQNRFSVVKPGLIIGTAGEGVSNTDDFLWRLVAAASLLKTCPLEKDETYMPITDVALVASEIIDQVTQDTINAFVDMSDTHGLPTSEFWSIVASELHGACEFIPWNTWVQRAMEDMTSVGETHPLWPVQHFVAEGGSIGLAKQLCVPDPESLQDAVRKNMQYLASIGFVGGEGTLVQTDVIRRGQ